VLQYPHLLAKEFTMGFFHDLFMLILAILAGIGLMHLSMMFQ